MQSGLQHVSLTSHPAPHMQPCVLRRKGCRGPGSCGSVRAAVGLRSCCAAHSERAASSLQGAKSADRDGLAAAAAEALVRSYRCSHRSRCCTVTASAPGLGFTLTAPPPPLFRPRPPHLPLSGFAAFGPCGWLPEGAWLSCAAVSTSFRHVPACTSCAKIVQLPEGCLVQ